MTTSPLKFMPKHESEPARCHTQGNKHETEPAQVQGTESEHEPAQVHALVNKRELEPARAPVQAKRMNPSPLKSTHKAPSLKSDPVKYTQKTTSLKLKKEQVSRYIHKQAHEKQTRRRTRHASTRTAMDHSKEQEVKFAYGSLFSWKDSFHV